MVRSLLITSSFPLAACLSRWGQAPGGRFLEAAAEGGGFNYTAALEAHEELDDQAIRAMPTEAMAACWSGRRSAGKLMLNGTVESAVASFAEKSAPQVATILTLGRTLKRVCLGPAWDGEHCRTAAAAMRRAVWPRLAEITKNISTFGKLQDQLEPAMKTNRMGGGVTADVPCLSGQGGAQLYYRHLHALRSGQAPTGLDNRTWRADSMCTEYLKAKTMPTSAKPILFTFVRDPMRKFIAGFREMAASGLIDSIGGQRVGTALHARRFLANVFRGTCDSGNVLLQLQSMMGPACESRFDFVGRLEYFRSEWHLLGAHAGCTGDLSWPREWASKADLDDNGAGEAMVKVLAAGNGRLMQSLCLWLLPDYIAFDYPLPPKCRHIQVFEEGTK